MDTCSSHSTLPRSMPRSWTDDLFDHHTGAWPQADSGQRPERRRNSWILIAGPGDSIQGDVMDKFTVYLVDDDAGVLKALSRLLRAKGYEVKPYSSSQEFLEQHDPAVPGCAVLDVSMPGLDGLELQQALTAGGSHRPVIFITGKGDIPTSVRAMRAGAIDFLTKPVSNEDLLEAIRRAEELDAESRKAQTDLASIKAKVATLTPRERQ